MKAKRRNRLQFYSFFNLGPTWRLVVMSRLGSFTPEEETVPTVQVGWIGPRASIFLVAVGNIIISKAFHLITLVD